MSASAEILLDGESLSRAQVLAVARGYTRVRVTDAARGRVEQCAAFLQEKIAGGAYYYGVNTGFGSNADRLLAGQSSDEHDIGESLLEELQHKLIESHAVCVGDPLPDDIVRAMMLIRINTLLRGHSGIRWNTLQVLLDCLNLNVLPIVPEKGSVGASGDLAPQSHIALMLIGQGEAKFEGRVMDSAQALKMAGLQAVRLGAKEGLALNNGTAQMLATGVLMLADLDMAVDSADIAAAMSMEAFCARSGAFEARVHALRPHPGQVETAAHLRQLLEGSSLIDLPYALAPQFRTWTSANRKIPALEKESIDLQWQYLSETERAGKESFYREHLPFRGGKKAQPQDAYSLRCVPQVHGAVRDSLAHAARVFEIELNAVTDNPLVFMDSDDAHAIVSAGHFHGMPVALALTALKSAIVPLASISERRTAKLVDPATNDGLPAFLIGNPDGTDSGMMIVQYTAAALVNELATKAHPATAYSVPTSANTEDHVSMGATEARHVSEMARDVLRVIGIEVFVASQALRLRTQMLALAGALARTDEAALRARVSGTRDDGFDTAFSHFKSALLGLSQATPGKAAQAVLHCMEQHAIAWVKRDHYFTPSMRATMDLVARGQLREAVKSACVL